MGFWAALLAGEVGLLVWLAEGNVTPRFAFAPLNELACLLLVWAVPASICELEWGSPAPAASC
jgi:hypothetical protein